jgi:hypothetical protein
VAEALIEFPVAIGGTADMDGAAASADRDAHDPYRSPRNPLVDYLVGDSEQYRRQIEAKRPGSPQVEHQFELRRQLDR